MERTLTCKSEHDARMVVLHGVRHGHAFQRNELTVLADCDDITLDAIMTDAALPEVEGWAPPVPTADPEVVDPGTIDEVLHETGIDEEIVPASPDVASEEEIPEIPETLGELDEGAQTDEP